MPAPDFPTLYDFEGQLEAAFQAVIQTALGGQVTAVLTSRSSLSEDTPRVEVVAVVGNALNQRIQLGSPVREVPNAFDGVVRVRIATCSPINGAYHGSIRGMVRYALSASANIINTTNLPYLQVLDLLPAGSSPMIIDEKEQDVSELHYSIKFAVNNSAWPG